MPAHQGKFVAYFRVSKDRPGGSSLDLEAQLLNYSSVEEQRETVLNYLNGGQLLAEFTEFKRGKRNNRPQFWRALAACKKLEAKLVIVKLDRLSRNLAFVTALMDSGVEF